MTDTLQNRLNAFNVAFSNQQLDEVMSYFAEDSEYRELNGNVAKGKTAIRGVFERSFAGAYGKMVFVSKNLILDDAKKEASFVWVCTHDLTHEATGFTNKLLSKLVRLAYGKHCYWEGIDYFIFDDDLNIISKQTYGKASVPKFIRGRFGNKT